MFERRKGCCCNCAAIVPAARMFAAVLGVDAAEPVGLANWERGRTLAKAGLMAANAGVNPVDCVICGCEIDGGFVDGVEVDCGMGGVACSAER